MFWKRLFSFFIPSPGALTLTWAALVVSLLLSLTITVITLAEPGVGSPAMLYGVVAFPPAVLILSIATLIERRPGARLLLWALVLGLTLLSACGVFLAGYLDADVSFAGTVYLLTCCCSPVFATLGLVLIFLGWKAYPAFQRTLRVARLQRMITMIQARGIVLISDLSAELSMGEPDLRKLILELISVGELMAYLDIEFSRVYSAAALNEKQRRLLAMINIQGKASLVSLAVELNVSRELVRQWVYSLAQRKQLHGFADWSSGTIYSQAVTHILAQNLCPHCGGDLDVAGKGMIQCEHCGVEMFL